ncbi:hypothetical protein [Halorussus sp. MSC15.2]|uniref:hypothetical protein n=1 Tax=Halorussus sp. MSC15.2 TaxID=2283638 RepID=UPI0013D102BD|nr:hypothetical protein [Halorussus sp. MSC15.2]NEU56605.1 hypothetical protein [Halorussus sp. MSC15.2]
MSLDYFRYYTRWNHAANRRRYAAPADPWNVVLVDPSEVEYYVTVSLKWGLGRVRGGEWDRPENCEELDETVTARGLRQRFEEGRAWEETVYYEWAKGKFEEGDETGEGNAVRGHETLEQFRDERLTAIDDLYDSIRRDGYRPNDETLYDDPSEVERVSDLEPLVVVGRSGDIRWNEGYHRLLLSSILGVDEIPVYVVRRYEEWQRKRDEMSGRSVSELSGELREYADHPDVQDVVS